MIESETPALSTDAVNITDLALDFIIGGMHEISIVEEEWFKTMV
jgi:hypothetical protein